MPTKVVFVEDRQGRRKRVSDGVFEDPAVWQFTNEFGDEDEVDHEGYYETQVVDREDVLDQLHEEIRAYMDRANAVERRGCNCNTAGWKEAMTEGGVEKLPRRWKDPNRADKLDNREDARGLVNRLDIQGEINQERQR